MDGRAFCTAHKNQTVYHGPVHYVDDPYRRLEAAASDLELALLLVFTKLAAHRAQREYRFLVWSEDDPSEDAVDLEVSPSLADAMLRPRQEPEGAGFVRAGPEEYSAVEYLDSPGPSKMKPHVETLSPFFGIGNPAAVLRGDDIDKPPGEPRETATVHSALEALRVSVDRSGAECRKDAAAAAWYAERVLKWFCATFGGGSVGVRVNEDGFIVLTAKLSSHDPLEVSIAASPEGTYACKISTARSHRALTAPDVRSFQALLKSGLADVGVRHQDRDDRAVDVATVVDAGAPYRRAQLATTIRPRLFPSGCLGRPCDCFETKEAPQLNAPSCGLLRAPKRELLRGRSVLPLTPTALRARLLAPPIRR